MKTFVLVVTFDNGRINLIVCLPLSVSNQTSTLGFEILSSGLNIPTFIPPACENKFAHFILSTQKQIGCIL